MFYSLCLWVVVLIFPLQMDGATVECTKRQLSVADTVISFRSDHYIDRSNCKGYQYTNGTIYLWNEHHQAMHYYRVGIDTIFQMEYLSATDIPFSSFTIHNLDTMFITTDREVLWLDLRGVIYRRTKLVGPLNMREQLGQYYAGFPACYDAVDSVLFIHQFHADCANNQRKCAERSIEVSIDLTTGELTELPIAYPVIFKKQHMALLKEVDRLVLPQGHLFSFEADPDLYLLNIKTGKVKTIAGQSSYQTKEIEPLMFRKKVSEQQLYDQYMTAPQYKNLYYDPYRKLVYRFFVDGQELKDETGMFNSLQDKQLYLMVFDEDLHLLQEIPLDRATHFHQGFVAPDGFYISMNVHKGSTDLRFKKLLIE